MSELPSDVAGYLLGLSTRSPAWVRVDGEGRVSEVGGEIQAHDLRGLDVGDSVLDRVEALHGILPFRGRQLVLPSIEVVPGQVVDIHLFSSSGVSIVDSQRHDVWVLFLDSALETERQRVLHQKVNDIALMREKLSKLEREISGVLPAAGRAKLLGDLLSKLDLAALELLDDETFAVIGAVPDWLHTLLREKDHSLARVQLRTRFPFLDHFLDEAEAFWCGGSRGCLKSGIWLEDGSSDDEYRLEATALLVNDRKVLLLERLSAEYEEQQSVIQKARDGKLKAQQHLRMQNLSAMELTKTRDELETRVAERTKELVAANEQLQHEIVDRQKAAERLMTYQEKLRSLALELSRAEEEERRRIAVGLHDHIGQMLAVSKIKISSLRDAAAGSEFVEPLEEIHSLLGEVIQYTRSLTFELGSPVLYELGLEAALAGLAERVEEQHHLAVRFEDDHEPKPLQEDVRVLLFQAASELLFNVTKHARASSVTVSIERRGGEVVVLVRDDGVGFDPESVSGPSARSGRFGLFSIRERLDHLGGRVEIESAPRRGTCVLLGAPIDKNCQG